MTRKGEKDISFSERKLREPKERRREKVGDLLLVGVGDKVFDELSALFVALDLRVFVLLRGIDAIDNDANLSEGALQGLLVFH